MNTNNYMVFIKTSIDLKKNKKPWLDKNQGLNKEATSYSPTVAVPSAQAGLTSLFGMGRGGAPPL